MYKFLISVLLNFLEMFLTFLTFVTKSQLFDILKPHAKNISQRILNAMKIKFFGIFNNFNSINQNLEQSKINQESKSFDMSEILTPAKDIPPSTNMQSSDDIGLDGFLSIPQKVQNRKIKHNRPKNCIYNLIETFKTKREAFLRIQQPIEGYFYKYR